MKTSALQKFLDSLGGSLAAIGVQPNPQQDLHAVAKALAPFSDLSLGDLTGFLSTAAEYRRAEKVPVVHVSGLEAATKTVCTLSAAVHALGEAEVSNVPTLAEKVTTAKAQLQHALSLLGGQFGFTVTFKEDKKWLPNLSQKARDKQAAEAAEAARKQAEELAKAATTQAKPPSENSNP